jgi:ribosomal protein S18 acetylase RimI-like enzyme
VQDTDLGWRAERALLRAWPALAEQRVDGWVLRFGEGLTRRANSANPLMPQPGNVDHAVADVEARYRSAGLPAIFRVPSLVDPSVERRLDALGYTAEGETRTLLASASLLDVRADEGVVLSAKPSVDWLRVLALLQGHDEDSARIYARIVDAIAVPAAFASIRLDGDIRALAYGAVHDRLLCIESVATDAGYRRRGLAARLLAALFAWGVSAGASGVCLQVMTANGPARALYHRLGLRTEVYRYHYRRQPGAR